MKNKVAKIMVLLLVVFSNNAFCEDGFYETEAQLYQAIECKQPAEAMSAGQVIWMFKSFSSDERQIIYDGLSLTPDNKYAPAFHRIMLTTIIDDKNGAYVFEGKEDKKRKLRVRGNYNSTEDFEINAYSKGECLEYRIAPVNPTRKLTSEDIIEHVMD